MREKAEPRPRVRRFVGLTGMAPAVLTVGAVVLAWQIIIQPLTERAPPAMAVRLAPGSPLVLRRAAEAELAAGRNDNAASLARDALTLAPFDIRALRVIGLTEARAGRTNRADELLTLAGNWSLRDDPAHAWLVENRLRRGDYGSAFAHADTLVRRRGDLHPQVFRLFTIAAREDPQRALPVLARLLAAEPPWRSIYLSRLSESLDGLQLAGQLALLLQRGSTPLTNLELERLYFGLLEQEQIPALKMVRNGLGRPAVGELVANGSFSASSTPAPFQWELAQKAGAVASIMPGDIAQRDPALRVEYDGYEQAFLARQLTTLEPGRYRLRAQFRTEAGNPVGRLVWVVSCRPQNNEIASSPAVANTPAQGLWTATEAAFTVPQGCPSQWLELRGVALDRRTPMAVWFDRISIVPSGAAN